MSIAVKLGKRLKMIRIAAGIKQKDLSKEFNIPASLLSMYESGSREPSLSFLEIFSTYFQLPLSQIFSLMENNSNKNEEDKSGSTLQEMKKLILSLEKEALKAKHNAR